MVYTQPDHLQSVPYASGGYGDQNAGFGDSQNANQYQEQGSYAASEGAYAQQGAPNAQQGAPISGFPPPAYFNWQSDHVNAVKLIGIVGTAPQLKILPGGKSVAHLRLGVRKSISNQREKNWMSVVFWDTLAYQAAQYVHKGAQIAVGGRLQQDEWTNTRGEREYMIKVVAAYFAIVLPSSPEEQTAGDTSPSVYPGQSFAPIPGTPWTSRPKGANTRPRRVFALWRENPGITWATLVAEQGPSVAPKGTLTNLVEGFVACPDVTHEEIARLASELQIGPLLSVFVTPSDLNTAIDEVVAANPGTTLDTLKLRPVREHLLGGGPQSPTRMKVTNQEKGCGAMEEGITYNQIRLAKFCKQKGFPLEELVVVNPRNLYELVGSPAVPV